MGNNKNYFLCGGVLFFLLTRVALPDVSAKEHKEGVADEHSDPILMKDLIYAFCGVEDYGTQKDTSDYKECKIEGGKNIPFKNVRLCSGYDQEVRSQYVSVLQRMDTFVRRHLDMGAKEWFVKAVLEIIEYDHDILDDEMFCPTEWINVNPVKNSYAALWEEYKELKNITSPIPLMNVIRRILEYYFLQICGYDGSQLRKTILEDKKHEFMHDEAGNEDPTKFDMAKSMLQYIAATTYGVNDGLHYVDDVIDIDQCRETFQMIFHHMGQDQHFNMMMGIK